MDKTLRLYTYIDGVNDTPFPSAESHAILTSFQYDSKRMGGAPTISATLMHEQCLDKLWTYNVYAQFNGEKFFIKQIPSSQRNNTDILYKHEVELVSERVVLDNVYFYDVVSADSNFDRPVSNSSQFAFFGDIREFVARMNESLKYCNVNYTLVVDNGISSESKLVSFENKVISEVLQEIYNTYEIPYYFTGHVIHVGFTDNAITETFKYGVDNSLLSIQKTNANYKIVTRVTGTGSSDNIPYYYPNSTEQGELSIRLNGQEGYVNIINQNKFSKVKAGSVFHYVEVDSLTADLSIGWRNISVVKLEPAEEGEAVKWEISARYYFSVAQTGDVTIKLGCNIDDSPSPITGVLMREGVEKPLYNFTENTYRINLTPATYYVNIKVEVVDHGNIIENYDNDDLMEYVFDVTSTQFFTNYQGWVLNDPSSSNIVSLYDYGLEISGATVSKGSRLEIVKTGWVQPQGYLMPPIYRQSGGMERFYNAINNKYPLADGGYYEFTNEYIEGKQKEHIVSFENIKPTIKGITNSLGYPIDVFVDFAYDLNDSDDIDEEGNYIHPYFFAKLRKFDGEYGFNLFEHAIQGNEMTISMTSGPCGACEFTIMVDNDTMQNTVQVDKDGNLYRDEEGNVLFGSPQEQQNNTRTHSVWIALKKDINTFGVVMPNATHNYKPRRGDDTFVILHIELPQAYITAAEYRLMQELIKYMKLNNDEKFNFSIAFSRIFFAENPDVLELLNENSRLQIEYNNERYELYVSSFSYKMKSNEPLPEITVELSDTLTISQNALQTSIDKIKQDVMQSVGSIDWLKLGLAYFLRKDQKDRTRHRLASDEGFEIGNFVSGVSGAFMFIDKQTLKSVLEIDKLYVRVKAYFEQLEIVNVNSIGGKQIISPAGGIHITKVEDGENAVDEEGNEYYNEWPYFRCYFTAEQDGESVGNRWHIGDLAYCKAFNLNTTSTGGGSRYYWRKVVNIGVDYIDLSRADCDVDSDKPIAGDVVCQRGNADDVDRQNFIEFSSVDSFSPSITLYQGINSYSLLGKEMIQYGVEKTTGKAFMYVYGDMYVGNRDGSSFIKYTPETGVQIKGTLDIGTKFGDKTLKEIIDSAGNVYKEDLTALQTALNKEMQNLQSQIDGAIETWFYDPAPTLENAPAKEWTTDEKRNIHLGDLYYSGEGRAYRFQLDTDTNTYYWNEIVDTDIKKALENAKKAQDTADGKRKIFARQPQHGESYDIGDMWVNATYPSDGSKYKEDMLRAVTANDGTQPFDIAHWQLASKYTDDTVANQALDSASKANEAVQKLEQGVKDFKDNVEGAFRDGIIDESETQALDANMKQIGALKDQVEKSYADIATNSLLAGSTELTTLGTAKTTFLTACQELLDEVAAAIADKVITDTERIAVNAKYDNFNTKYGDYNKTLNACIRYVEEKLNESISTYSYLKEALKQETTIAGGLVQTTSLVLGYKGSDGAYNVMAGSNGLVTSKGNKTPAFWMGGDMIDLFDVYSSSTGGFDREAGVRYAQGMDRMDGTGYRANGNLWWDADGRVHADPLSFFVGENTVGALLASFQVVLKADGIHPDYLIPQVPFQSLTIADTLRIGEALVKYDATNKAVYVTHPDGSTDTIGFYAEGWVSAKGVNSSSTGGGGGGASALYQLIDVLPNDTNDGVYGASTGKVLMYNGTKWQAGDVVSDISTLTLNVNGSSLFTYDGKYSITANLTVPTKVSQLTNDSGYLTAITKAQVEGVLTGDITSHTHSFVSLTSKPTTISGYGITDAIYFTEDSNYLAARFVIQSLANKAANTYIEWWQSGAGFFNHKAAKYIVNGGTSSQFLKGDGSLDSTAYLPLSGGTLTGSLILARDSYYYDSKYGLNCNNSDIVGANSIYFGDLSDYASEGIHFYRDSTHWDSIWIKNGVFYFNPNRLITDMPSTGYIMLHSSNYNSYALPLSGGTMTGPIKFSYNNNGNCNVSRASGFSMFYGKQSGATNYGFPFQYSSVISFMTGYCGMQFANYGGYGDTRLLFRNISDQDTWTSWYTLLHSGNYNSYSPKLDGTGASGTWGISITGNADTVDSTHLSMWYKHAHANPSGTSNKPWHKIATFSFNTANNNLDTSIAFYISEYYSNRYYGIFTVRARAESRATSITWLTVDFMVNAGVPTTDIVATWKNTGGYNITINIYAHRKGWSSYSFRKIEEQQWGRAQDAWVTLNAYKGGDNCYASIPSDENKTTSTNITISNNVASATKLQTARTIWGQDFNGTGNVDNILTLNYSSSIRATGIELQSTNNSESSIGFTSNSKRAVVGIWGDSLHLWTSNGKNILNIPNDSNGYVGIGTTSPAYKLDVNGTARCSNLILPTDGRIYNGRNYGLYVNDYTNGYGSAIYLTHDHGQTQTAFRIHSHHDSGIGGLSIGFSTTEQNYGSSPLGATYAEIMHMRGNGNVGIGTTSPSVKLHVIGNIAATGAVTAKASSSDIRLKTDISDYKALSIIRGHKSIKYHWNAVAKANADIFNDDYWHYGLIAQDVQRDMPQMVSDVFKDYLVIQYERLIPIMWRGIQEVDDEVARLKKKVRKLEMEIRELKQKEDRL